MFPRLHTQSSLLPGAFYSEGFSSRVLQRSQPRCFPIGPHNLVNEETSLLFHFCVAEIKLGQSLVVCQPFKQLLPTILQKDERGWLKEDIQKRSVLLLFPPPRGNFCCCQLEVHEMVPKGIKAFTHVQNVAHRSAEEECNLM